MKEGMFAVGLILIVIWFSTILMGYTEPNCPPGSTAKSTRNGWYCVVPAVR